MREQLAKPIPLHSEEQEKEPYYRLYFAGEACSSPMYNGSLAGAYEAGFKAARLILEHFPKEEPERFMARAKPALRENERAPPRTR